MTRRLAAVLGRDVARSLSPVLHGAAAAALGVDLAYVPVKARDPARFGECVDALVTLGALGANVTAPYKAAALARADRVSAEAQRIGAVNTLTFGPTGVAGHNTDGPGLRRALEQLPEAALERVQVLGAGGAARAAVWALDAVGAKEIVVTARRNALAVADLVGARSQALEAVPGVTLVISTLPGDPELAKAAAADWIDGARRPIVYDLAYGAARVPAENGRPARLEARDSALVQAARGLGLKACDGRVMLVEQAALAFRIWTGAPLEPVRSAMGAALGLEVRDGVITSAF